MDVYNTISVAHYKAMITPLITYECEVWTLRRKTEEVLETFRRKVSRTIYGPFRANETLKIRFSHELKDSYVDHSLVNLANLQKLKWTGHIVRMEVRRITERKFLEIKNKPRPHTRAGACFDDISPGKRKSANTRIVQ